MITKRCPDSTEQPHGKRHHPRRDTTGEQHQTMVALLHAQLRLSRALRVGNNVEVDQVITDVRMLAAELHALVSLGEQVWTGCRTFDYLDDNLPYSGSSAYLDKHEYETLLEAIGTPQQQERVAAALRELWAERHSAGLGACNYVWKSYTRWVDAFHAGKVQDAAFETYEAQVECTERVWRVVRDKVAYGGTLDPARYEEVTAALGELSSIQERAGELPPTCYASAAAAAFFDAPHEKVESMRSAWGRENAFAEKLRHEPVRDLWRRWQLPYEAYSKRRTDKHWYFDARDVLNDAISDELAEEVAAVKAQDGGTIPDAYIPPGAARFFSDHMAYIGRIRHACNEAMRGHVSGTSACALGSAMARLSIR